MKKKNLIKIAISVRKNKNPDEISVEKRVPYNSVAVRTKRADRFWRASFFVFFFPLFVCNLLARVNFDTSLLKTFPILFEMCTGACIVRFCWMVFEFCLNGLFPLYLQYFFFIVNIFIDNQNNIYIFFFIKNNSYGVQVQLLILTLLNGGSCIFQLNVYGKAKVRFSS